MMISMENNKTGLSILLYLYGLVFCCSLADAAWYQGCYDLPNVNPLSRQAHQPSYDTPARCAKRCLGKARFSFLYSGSECLCRNGLTRRTEESNCYQRCSGDNYLKCGARRYASVFSTSGPYIAALKASAEPTLPMINKEAKFTVNVELASDWQTHIGIKRLDRMSFAQVRITVRMPGGMKTHAVPIRGRKGVLNFSHIFQKEGLKYIEFTAENDISSLSIVVVIRVTTKVPKSITIQIIPQNRDHQPTCAPDMDDMPSLESVVFAGQSPGFNASVEHGINVTYIWNFCDVEVRNISQPYSCANGQCSNFQEFTFTQPGMCQVRVRVYNDFGTVESILNVSIISPELHNVTIAALPQENELRHDDTEDMYSADYFSPWEFQFPGGRNMGNIEEGGTGGGRYLGGGETSSSYPFSHYQSPNLFPFLPERNTNPETEDGEEDNKHIPLPEDMYLMEYKVKFQVSAYVTSLTRDAKVKIDFGDGEKLSQNLESQKHSNMLGLSPSRMKRHISRGNKRLLPKKMNLEINSPTVHERKRRGFSMDNLLGDDEMMGPYSPDTQPLGMAEMEGRGGLFQLGGGSAIDPPQNKPVIINYGSDCLLHLSFHHEYQKPGKYDVKVEIFNGTHAVSVTLDPPLRVLDGTPALNLRCPEAVETGKSVILSASSTKSLPEILNWNILRQSDDGEDWMSVQDEKTVSSSFKKSFLVRGKYKVELVAMEEGLATSCQLQVEEPLSGLSVNVEQTFVVTGNDFSVDISLVSGSAAEIEVHFGYVIKPARLRSRRAWTARFRVMEPRCHDVFVVARNLVSNLTSRAVQICGEEQLSGFGIIVGEYGEINTRIPITFVFERGSNVTVLAQIESISGRVILPYRKQISGPMSEVEILSPKLEEAGTYKVVGRAYNHVPAKSETCDVMKELTASSHFVITHILKPGARAVLLKKPTGTLRGQDNQENTEYRAVVYMLELDDQLLDTAGLGYLWKLQNVSGDLQAESDQILQRYSSSPLFTIRLPQCEPSLRSSQEPMLVANQNSSEDAGWFDWPKCRVSVEVISRSGKLFADDIIHDDWKTLSQSLIRPQKIVIESGKSGEFDVKCPPEEGDICEVSFGDGKEPMKIPSNANWISLSHAFTSAQLYEVTLKSSISQQGSDVLYTTSVIVQERISGTKIEGTQLLEYEESARGSWRVTTGAGSHKVYVWSVYSKMRTKIHEEYGREMEMEFTFRNDGEYIVVAKAYNEINEEQVEVVVVVQQIPLHFTVQAETSVLGKPSTFIVETNATTNIIGVRYEENGRLVEYDLNCLKPNSTTFVEGRNPLSTYVIAHEYDSPGSYETTFALLSRAVGKGSKRLYAVTTEVLHRPAPKKILLEIIRPNAAEDNYIYYVPSGRKVVVRAKANYATKIFNWIVRKERGAIAEIDDPLPSQAINGSTAEYTFIAGRLTSYNISVVSFPKKSERQSSIAIKAEDVITKLRVESPFNAREGRFVNFCRLRRFRVNGTSVQRCDELVLTAFSDGTHVTYHFYIKFHEEDLGDYVVPTEVVDVVSVQATPYMPGKMNEVNIKYAFKEQGVYRVTVTASNHLGNMSADIPAERTSFGMKPFLLHAQRPVPQIQLTQERYYVELNKTATFEIKPLKQVVDFEWRMGDGTIINVKSGHKVEHRYEIVGKKELFVTAKNFVNDKTTAANVTVETPIKRVELVGVPFVCSTRKSVRLHARVYPQGAAWNYTWYWTSDGDAETVYDKPYIDHLFHRSDIYLVKVLAANGIDDEESNIIEIEVQEPIIATLDCESVVLKNKEMELSVTLITGSEVSVSWTIDGGPELSDKFELKHTFTEVGIHTVEVVLKNKLDIYPIKKQIFVDENPCVMGELEIVNGERPINIFRSKTLRLEADLFLNCSDVAQIKYEWTVRSCKGDSMVLVPLANIETTKRVLELPPRTLEYGCHVASAKITMADSIQFKEINVTVHVHESKLVPLIEGGGVREISRDSEVVIDASFTYDPDFPEEKDDFSFKWSCFILNSPRKSCFNEEALAQHTESDAPPGPTSALRAADVYHNQPEHDDVYGKFPTTVDEKSGRLVFSATLLGEADVFIFKVEVSKGKRSSDTTVVLEVRTEHTEWVKVNCSNCDGGQVHREIPLVFNADCTSCVNEDGGEKVITYTWKLQEVKMSRYPRQSFLENGTRDCAPRDGSGWSRLIGILQEEADILNSTYMEDFFVFPEIDNGIDPEIILHPADSNFTGFLPPMDGSDFPLEMKGASKSESGPFIPKGESISEGKPVHRRTDMDTALGNNENPSYDEQYFSHHAPIPSSTVPILHGENLDTNVEPRNGESEELPEDSSEGHHYPETPASSQASDMRGGYVDSGPRDEPSHGQSEVEEGYTGFGRDLQEYIPGAGFRNNQGFRNGYFGARPTPTHPPPDAMITPDLFRTEDPSHKTPSAKHYKGKTHILMDSAKFSLNGMSSQYLILKPNSLEEGKTYAVTVDVEVRSGNDTASTKGRSTYYISILRGPSQGQCTVLPRRTTQNFQVYCMQWKNQQNEETDTISRKEMLRYEISYSMTEEGPKRHIYSGVNNERYFNLPLSAKPAIIHIVLRNSEGASTKVCSFPQKVTDEDASESSSELLENAYTTAVGKNSKLSRVIAKGDKDEIISLTNVILDTLPKQHELQKLKDAEMRPYGAAKKTISAIIKALNSIKPNRIKEVIYVLEALTRTLERGRLVMASAVLEAAELLIDLVHTIGIVNDAEPVGRRVNGIFTDVEIMDLLVLTRYRLSMACKQCTARIRGNASTNEITEASRLLGYGNNTKYRATETDLVLRKLVNVEREVYDSLEYYFVELLKHRPKALGELRSLVGEYGVVVQPFEKSLNVYDDDGSIFGNESGQWRVGAVFPEDMGDGFYHECNTTQPVQIASTLPDLTLGNFQKNFIENRPMHVAVYKNASHKMKIENLKSPIVIALPPRKADENFIRGKIMRDHVVSNRFSVIRRHNRTLHVEVIIEAKQRRSFPVTIAVTDVRASEQMELIHPESIIAKKTVSRLQFQNFRELNSTIGVKFTLKDRDFRRDYGRYFVSLWNDQAMTSRSRHYDICSIPYTLRIWWSDCFYWDPFLSDWRQDGVNVLDISTSTQTLCTSNHLSSFSSSYLAVTTNAQASDLSVPIGYMALRGSAAILVLLVIVTATILYVHHQLLRSRDVETSTSLRNDYYGSRPRFSEIGRRFRWFFGPNHNNNVPILLHDNRKKHKQVYEIKIQTSCWPGSGTSSNVSLILYGEEGKYEARELLTPKTHEARETRYENGYSDNDDYTGIDEELFITGSLQTFIVSFPENLGPLWKITLWHDHCGEHPRWKLDYVIVRDVSTGEKFHFPCYQWLALDRGERSLSVDLCPVNHPPSLYTQIGFKFHAFVLNFSSIFSLIASPGYGKLTRCQRVVHLSALVVTICGLATLRYMLGWDIYSHDSDLPYMHSVSVSWGLIIGLVASAVILPAQLLLRCSKHDDRISVTIEDATGSVNGLDFSGDYRSHHDFTSSEHKGASNPHFPRSQLGRKSPQKDFEAEEISECVYSLPSVEDAVYDWLELKAWSESKSEGNLSKCEIDKDFPLPEVRSVSSHNWRQSTNSLDEEIMRCMMSSSPIRRSRDILRETPLAQNAYDVSEHKKTFLSVPASHCGSIASPLSHHRGSLTGHTTRISVAGEAISTPLAMDGPELVPCEKLGPMPEEVGAPLPRECRKVALAYYAIVCLSACVLTLYGSVATIRPYDIGPWLECIVFSIVSAVVIVEGGFIILASVIFPCFRLIRWYLNDDDTSDLLDDLLSPGSQNSVALNSEVHFIESTNYNQHSTRECLSPKEEILAEDARFAREIADRERVRYLRYAKPIVPPVALKQKALNEKLIEKVTKEWLSVAFLLIIGIVCASVISSGYSEANGQSRDVEAWFKGAMTSPDKSGHIFEDDTYPEKSFHFSYVDIRTRSDWVRWFKSILPKCPKSEEENEKIRAEQAALYADYLLRYREIFRPLPKPSEQHIKYMMVGTPTMTICKVRKFKNADSIPEKMMQILRHTPNGEDSRLPEINGILGGGTTRTEAPPEDKLIVYKVPSFISNRDEKIKHLDDVMNTVRDHPDISSVTVSIVLQNPYTKLYSQISAKTNFHNEAGFASFGKVSGLPSLFVTSVALSQRSSTGASMNAYYLCQVLLLLWVSYKFMRALISLSGRSLSRFTESLRFTDKKIVVGTPAWPLAALDVFTWTLAVVILVYSGYQRSYTESIMPTIYGYANADTDTGEPVSLKEIMYCSTRLATAFGLFNFILIVKVLNVAKHFHGLPRIPLFTNRKHAMGQIVTILFLFWALALLLAFVGYLTFGDDSSFSDFLRSVMVIVLSSVTLGLLPVNLPVDMATMRAKYGYVATTWFFLALFVSFRLILKGFLLATYSKDKKHKTDTGEKETVDEATETATSDETPTKGRDGLVNVTDMLKYNAQKMKMYLTYAACIVLRKDPSTWELGNNVEFSSLGFSKAKQIAEKEKKLSLTESFPSQPAPISDKVLEKADYAIQEPSLTPSKYSLPTEVWLMEVESQLEELYSRASALADSTYEEIPLEALARIFLDSKKMNDDVAGVKSPSQLSCNSASSSNSAKSDEEKTAKMTNEKLFAQRKRRGSSEGKPPIRRAIEQRGRRKQQAPIRSRIPLARGSRDLLNAVVRGGNDENKTPNASIKVTRSFDRRGSTPNRRISRIPEETETTVSPSTPKKMHVKRALRSSPDIQPREQDSRRFGWLSDMDDSSDFSRASSSCFGERTPVPPLTTHNLARHNYHLLSRQSSLSQGTSQRSSENTQPEDVPSTSKVVYEAQPETVNTISGKLWKALSSFKKAGQGGSTSVRPLRRSRTAAINPRDIPSLESLQDSDIESEGTGKRSSASTTKLQAALKTTSAYRGLTKRRKACVRAFDSGSQVSSVTPSGSPVSEMTSLPSGSSDVPDHDDFDTFSIPGRVLDDSDSQVLKASRTVIGTCGKFGDTHSPTGGRDSGIDSACRSKSQISSCSRSSRQSQRSAPAKISEEPDNVDERNSEDKVQKVVRKKMPTRR